MKENKKPFYKRLIESIKDFDKYEEFVTEDISEGFKYFLKLTLLLSFFVAIAFTIKTGQVMDKAIGYLKNDAPYFRYENKELTVDSKDAIIYENSGNMDGIVIIDTEELTEEKNAEYDKKFALYNNGILLTKDKVTVKSASFKENITQTYEEILNTHGIENFNKNTIKEYFSNSKMISIYITIFITLLISFIIVYLLELIIEAITPMIFGFISSRIVGLKLKFQNILNITVHAMTLSVILRIIYIMVNIMTGFYIKYFDTMYITIIYIYIITAIFIIKSNLIKQQMELMKIIEEQKNVREEIRQRENEDKEDEKKEEQDEKSKGKKEEDNNIGKEANGEV